MTLTAPADQFSASARHPDLPTPERSPRERATSDFTALTRQVTAAGLMRRRYGYYWTKLVVSALALCGWVVGFVQLGDSWWQLANAVVLALLLTQVAFLGHDAAHRQIFASGRWNDAVSLLVTNLFVGISHGWWKNKHNRHHAAPNKEGADPDIALGAVAMTPAMAARHSNRLLAWLTARQGWYFFPLLCLEGLSLHVSSVRRAFGPSAPGERRWVEATFLVIRLAGLVALVFWVLPPGLAVLFLAVQLGVFGFYLGAAFAPNHIGMPLVSARLKLDFLRRQVLVSRNISGGPVMSVLMGGLNYQVEHHLFPSMARPHLRKVAPLVRAHCAEIGVPYTQISLLQSYVQVTRYLHTVGLKGNDPFLCPLVAQRRSL